ncbi:PilZ domain-containing protein [Thiovibrio sp. JS02]
MKPNKRKRSRLALHTEVTVGTGNQKVLRAMSKDISMNGLFILSEERIPVGAVCGIEITVSGKSSNLRIRAKGIISRHAPDGMGIQFQDDLEWWPVLEDYFLAGINLDTGGSASFQHSGKRPLPETPSG